MISAKEGNLLQNKHIMHWFWMTLGVVWWWVSGKVLRHLWCCAGPVLPAARYTAR